MGQNSSAEITNKELLEKLTFILDEHIPHLGEVKVYRLTQKPYDYYVRYREVFPATPQHQVRAVQTRSLYRNLEGHRNIVKVEILHVDRQNDLCSSSILMDSYARYHNYTLEKAIKCKRQNGKMFRDCDLLYLLNSLIEVGIKLNQHAGSNYLGVFQSHRLYLSTEGFLKVYLFRLLPHSHDNEPPPYQTEKEDCFHTHETDLKDLGYLMTQLCLLENRNELAQLSKQHTKFRLQKGLAGRISPGIRSMIIRLLEGEEVDWSILRYELDNIRQQEGLKASYCIRLQEDISMRESEIMLRQNQQLAGLKASRQLMLSSVHMNLVPDPIQPVSKKQKH